jgi:hypothetical protein
MDSAENLKPVVDVEPSTTAPLPFKKGNVNSVKSCYRPEICYVLGFIVHVVILKFGL